MSDIKRELNEQISALRDRLWAIEAAEQDAIGAALVGKYFRDRNCYSCPESESDYWNEYRHVLSCEGTSLNVIRFRTDSRGESSVQIEDCYPAACLGEEISAEEYEAARDHFLTLVKKTATFAAPTAQGVGHE